MSIQQFADCAVLVKSIWKFSYFVNLLLWLIELFGDVSQTFVATLHQVVKVLPLKYRIHEPSILIHQFNCSFNAHFLSIFKIFDFGNVFLPIVPPNIKYWIGNRSTENDTPGILHEKISHIFVY